MVPTRENVTKQLPDAKVEPASQGILHGCVAYWLGDSTAKNAGRLTLNPIKHIDVVGTSKGKGYAGAIKRWNQHRLRESHGTGPVARHAGSMGSCSTPSRVFKGKRLPGHLGAERVTIQNLKVVKVDAENNLIAIKGAIPGPKGSVVCISDSVQA